jgi:homoserine O-succinyltransferase
MLQSGLPARHTLQDEGVDVIGDRNARRWETRPLRIALLNLMPQKAVTETQIARLLGSTPHQIELTLFVPDGYAPKTTADEHLDAFYKRWSDVRAGTFDGLIVTGAPLELLAFEDVGYWHELTEIFDWAQDHVHRCYYICWAAQAALYHFHGVPKRRLDQKVFGVYRQRVARTSSTLLRGFGETFVVPASRHAEVRREDLPRGAGLEVLAESADAGLCLIEERDRGAIYMFNHLEYDAETLEVEYRRDLEAGKAIAPPRNYFPDDDASKPPVNRWRCHAQLLFRNWVADMHRGTPFSRAREQTVDWLSVGLKMPTIVGRTGTDMLVVGEDHPDTLPAILRRLAELDLSPQSVRVHRQADGTAFIILRLDLDGERTAERVSRSVVELAQVKRLAYRGTDGWGGLLVEDPNGIAPAPCLAAPAGNDVPVMAASA